MNDDEGTEVIDDTAPAGDGSATSVADPPPAPAASLSVDAVRTSPEYRELAKQNRKLARELGSAKATEASVRATAEAERQAAEAQQLEAQAAQMVEILGDEGLAEWEAIAELSTTNQVEAARRFKELMTRAQAQSQPPEGAPVAAGSAEPAEGTPTVTTPAVPPRGVDADQPLMTKPGEEQSTMLNALEQQFTDVGNRVQQQAQGGRRVSYKERAQALIGYVAASYIKGGARPRS